jgi:hypothetical protein
MPDTPKITIEVTKKEASVLEAIRLCSPFGKIVVQKMNDIIVRIEKTESIMVKDDGTLVSQTLK